MTNGAQAPELLIVVDTEEEFDWTQPFDRRNTQTSTVPAQERAHRLYDRLGIKPTYVVDYPVATDPRAVEFLQNLKQAGRAEIGAHLHSWVTPPHHEVVNAHTSYQCNLAPALKQAKIERLTFALEKAFGERPTVFKSGRYGIGPRTPPMLARLGYKVDCSILPFHDLRADGGPDFRQAQDQPHWIAGVPDLLEVPVTSGFFGRAPTFAERIPGLFTSRAASALRIPGLLGRTGVATRSRLTPEGVPAAEQCALLEALVQRGRRTFSLYYHSPSLTPGHTPYVRTEADLELFLERLEVVLTFFRDRLGGRFTTFDGVYARMSAERVGAPAAVASSPKFVPAAAS